MSRTPVVSDWLEGSICSLSLNDTKNMLVCLAHEFAALQLATRFTRNAVTGAVKMM